MSNGIWIESEGAFVTEMSTWSANNYPMADNNNAPNPSSIIKSAHVEKSSGNEILSWEFEYEGDKYVVFND